MKRFDIINSYIKKFGYRSYLEIGVQYGVNLSRIECKRKVGVDPKPVGKGKELTNHKMTSDEFFEQNKRRFEIVFIDGLHQSDQVYRDISNSLKILTRKGTIVCHDMKPTREELQTREIKKGTWLGDCWKAWVQLRQERDDLEMFVIDTDWGCGVIRRGKQKKLNIDCEVTYENYAKNMKEWLNLISVDQFKERLENAR